MGEAMSEKVVLDLPVLLPDALDGRDRCVARLTATMSGAPGLQDVHVVDAVDGAPARLCLHYDPATTNLARIRGTAEAAGARLTEQFQHVLWTVSGINHIRRARTVAQALRRVDGVAEAEVTPGLVRVELDRDKLDDEGLRKVLGQLAVDATGPRAGQAGDEAEAGEHRHGGPFGDRSELI